jgi:hypothetical protein
MIEKDRMESVMSESDTPTSENTTGEAFLSPLALSDLLNASHQLGRRRSGFPSCQGTTYLWHTFLHRERVRNLFPAQRPID